MSDSASITQAQLSENSFDVLVIGAGPTGLACAIDAQKEGFRVALVDKGCLCNSLFHYPSHMTFFTTPELLEIGNIPFSTPNQKPNRQEALEYYRKVAAHYKLDLRLYQQVTASPARMAHLLLPLLTSSDANIAIRRAS